MPRRQSWGRCRERTRSRRHWQLRDREPDRPQRPPCLAWDRPARRRPCFQCAAGRQRPAERLHGCGGDGSEGARPPTLPAQFGDPRDDPRRRRRDGADRRLCAALPPLRPHVPPAHAGAAAGAGGRPAAHHHTVAADLLLRRIQAADHQRQQSHPVRGRCGGHAAHDRQFDHLHPARDGIRARSAVDPDRGRRREHHRGAGLAGPHLSRRDRGLLAYLGARPEHSVRLADGGDPCGDHLEALQLRGYRCGAGGVDHLRAGSGGNATHMGLSLLLAARLLLHGDRPESPFGDAHHGALRAVHRRYRRGGQRARRGRSDRATFPHRARHGHGGTDHRDAARLSRLRPGAHRQRGGPPAPERHLWVHGPDGRADVLGRASAPSRRHGALPPAVRGGGRGAQGGAQAGRRSLGIPRARGDPYLLCRHVLGRSTSARHDRAPRGRRFGITRVAGSRRRAAPGNPATRHDGRRLAVGRARSRDGRCLEPGPARDRPAPFRRSALPRDARHGRQEAGQERLRHALCRGRRFRQPVECILGVHVLVYRRPGERRAAGGSTRTLQ